MMMLTASQRLVQLWLSLAPVPHHPWQMASQPKVEVVVQRGRQLMAMRAVLATVLCMAPILQAPAAVVAAAEFLQWHAVPGRSAGAKLIGVMGTL